jgi:hypothetical protein
MPRAGAPSISRYLVEAAEFARGKRFEMPPYTHLHYLINETVKLAGAIEQAPTSAAKEAAMGQVMTLLEKQLDWSGC